MIQSEPAANSTPRWVKVSGIIATVLILFVLFVVFTGLGGPHGPARHAPSGDSGRNTSSGLLILLGLLVIAGVVFIWSWLAAHGIGPRKIFVHIAWPSMTMSPGLRKLALSAHITTSVGLLGAVASFLALAIAGLTSQDAQVVRGAYLSMEMTARVVIVPLAFGTLLFGIVQSLGTKWGLFRHWWVLVKFLLTVLVIIILLLQMEAISFVADAAAQTTLSSADLRGARRSLVTHAGLGLLVLLVPVALSLYKPRGMTRYGAHMQFEDHRK